MTECEGRSIRTKSEVKVMDVSSDHILASSPPFAVVPSTPPNCEVIRTKAGESNSNRDHGREVPNWESSFSYSSQGLSHEVPVWNEEQEPRGHGWDDRIALTPRTRTKRFLLDPTEVNTGLQRVPSKKDLNSSVTDLPLTQLSQVRNIV